MSAGGVWSVDDELGRWKLDAVKRVIASKDAGVIAIIKSDPGKVNRLDGYEPQVS